ncbi:hypothetical protein DICVIV_12710 [Dictyocaulus viviparus]|uniref:G-protein coupled receptors family 1 profile domain-containing protein n=1 Tax=Dictyocaulus viviparus TaxID=29172 RepID=A0A0D8XG29_DICVI|nr:hypothetical protein DICVIV_12710 [Dictyocaulus viviparus]
MQPFNIMCAAAETTITSEAPTVKWMLLHHLSIILLTIFGNCLLVYVILKNNAMHKRKRVTPVQMLMLHMCAADMLFALITMVPTMAITATVPIFHGPDLLCKTVKFLQVIPMYASSFLLVAISADRFQWCVTHVINRTHEIGDLWNSLFKVIST